MKITIDESYRDAHESVKVKKILLDTVEKEQKSLCQTIKRFAFFWLEQTDMGRKYAEDFEKYL